MSKSAKSTPPHPIQPPKTSSTPTPHKAAMVEPKNSQKGGRAGSRIGPDPKEGNHEKGKAREKYRTAIPKQANQVASKSQMADSQRPRHGGNHNNTEKTLTDTQLMEPTCTMDERGNDDITPESGENAPAQQTEPSQLGCYSPEEEEELRKLEMQMQNIEDGHNSDVYLEYMKADQSSKSRTPWNS